MKFVEQANIGDLLVFFPTSTTFLSEPALHIVIDITSGTIKTRSPCGLENRTIFKVWERFIPGVDYQIFSTDEEKCLAALRYA